MDEPQAAIEICLRALTAIMEMRQPEPTDVEQLRRMAPDFADRPVEELACEVVRQASKDLRQSRRAAGS